MHPEVFSGFKTLALSDAKNTGGYNGKIGPSPGTATSSHVASEELLTETSMNGKFFHLLISDENQRVGEDLDPSWQDGKPRCWQVGAGIGTPSPGGVHHHPTSSWTPGRSYLLIMGASSLGTAPKDRCRFKQRCYFNAWGKVYGLG